MLKQFLILDPECRIKEIFNLQFINQIIIMKRRVFIIHGWDGNPKEGWFPWLKKELTNKNFSVKVPSMPYAENPEISKWVSYLARLVGKPDKDTYFIGHSIGCQAILRYLETINIPIGGAVFVAGWFNLENLEDDETRKIARPWIETPIDIKKIKKVFPKSALIISDNDPYGAFEENKRKFKELSSEIIVLHNAGHISEDDGFTEIPTVIEQLQKIL